MVMTRRRAGGLGSGSGSGTSSKPIDEALREFIAFKITIGILNATQVMFGSIKEGIMEFMEDRLWIFRVNLVASQSGTRTLSFKDFRGCGAPDFIMVKDPIITWCWIVYIECAQMTSFCHDGSKVRFVARCLRE